MFSIRSGMMSPPISEPSTPMPVTEPSTPTPFDHDEDMVMQDDAVDDEQTSHLKDKLERLELFQQAVAAASTPTVRCEDLVGEMRAVKLRLAYCDTKHRELGGRYKRVPAWVKEHKALLPKIQAACTASFGGGKGESISDVVLKEVSGIVEAAETGMRDGDGDSALINIQVAEELLAQVNGTLGRLEQGVVEHEKLWGRR